MKKRFGVTLALALGLLSANVAMANDAVIGALIGGGAGALVGRSIGGRDGTIIGGALGAAAGAAIGSEERHSRRVEYREPRVYYSQPIQEVYYPPERVYYSQPVRVVQPEVYYVRGYDHGRRDWKHHRHDRDRYDRGGYDYRR